MLRKIEKSGKSVKEAVALAAEEFGVAPEELSYEVTRQVGKGLMKLLVGSEVDIVAWVTKDAEKEEKKVEKPAKKEEKAAKNAPETKEKAEAKPERKPKHENRSDFVIPKESVDAAKSFLSEVLKKIGIEANIAVKLDGNTIYLDVSGEKMGLLIGKRGDTLDAVQYLTSLYVNKGKGQYIKVSVDTENYRLKREETLVRLAKGLQRRVVRDNETITLEPMSPNERRIIHATLQHDKRITTYSVGEEPNRRLVVAPAGAKSE